MSHATISVEVVTTMDQFCRLQAEWDGLLDDSDQQTFFLRWSWNFLWWKHFAPPDGELYIVCCRSSENELVGVAPLYTFCRRVMPGCTVREVALIGMGIELKTSEYVDFFARRGTEQPVGEAIAAALKHDQRWDRLSLLRVPAESAVAVAFMTAMGTLGRSAVCDRSHHVDTSHGWEHYKQALGRSMRRNVEYYARRLFKRYDCQFALVESPEVIDAAMDDFVRLHQARWRAAGEPGIFTNPQVVAFVKAAIRQNLPQDRVRLWTLTIEGQVEAALLGFLDNGVLHYFQKGFNPSFRHENLGTALLGLCIHACCNDEQIRTFDFMGGGARYKAMWARHERATILHEVSRRNLRTTADAALRSAVAVVGRTYRSVIPQWLRQSRREWLKRRRFEAAIKGTWLLPFATEAWSVISDVLPLLWQVEL